VEIVFDFEAKNFLTLTRYFLWSGDLDNRCRVVETRVCVPEKFQQTWVIMGTFLAELGFFAIDGVVFSGNLSRKQNENTT